MFLLVFGIGKGINIRNKIGEILRIEQKQYIKVRRDYEKYKFL